MNEMTACQHIRTEILALSTLLLSFLDCSAQLSRPGDPYPMEYPGSPRLKVYELSVTQAMKEKALAIDSESLLKPAKSGILIDVDYNPENTGTWDTVTNGLKIWRAAFYVKDANTMNLVFAPYQLEKGVKIFLYNFSRKTVLGAFTDINNKTVDVLATAYVPGDLLIVEMQVPGFSVSYGSLAIDGVGCDFYNSGNTSQLKDGWFGTSGDCNIDINCTDDSLYQSLKHAVVRIVYAGGERCTGTLLNNTQQDGVNYIITAGHCISNEKDANEALFYFDYESPWCKGPDGSNDKSVSGATLRSTGNDLDFSLVELLEPVPFTYKPYYAGWDVSGYPPASGATIHHPLGDVKKISREDHPMSVTSFGHGYVNNTHFLVRHWESGTTEAGSSGAAYFDQTGRVAGTLTGGMADCTNSVNDYFQMISHAWDDYPEQGRQLAYWLDPLNKQPGYVNGYDPYHDFWSTGDTLTNILPGESLVKETGSLAWGSYSGHNSEYLTGFAEKYSTTVSKKVMGLLLQVAENYIASAYSGLNLTIWEGGNIPGNVVYEKEILLADLAEESNNFIEFDSIITVGKTFFAGYKLSYGTPQDTFSVYMAQNRLENKFNTAWVYDGYQWQSLADFTSGTMNSSFAVMPVVFDSLPEPVDVPAFTEDIIAYPNPVNSYVWVEFHDVSPLPVDIIIYNAQGQIVLENKYGPYQRVIRLEQMDLNTGIYFIRVKQGDAIYNLKITKIK
jgi:lysyl endopeptidase